MSFETTLVKILSKHPDWHLQMSWETGPRLLNVRLEQQTSRGLVHVSNKTTLRRIETSQGSVLKYMLVDMERALEQSTGNDTCNTLGRN